MRTPEKVTAMLFGLKEYELNAKVHTPEQIEQIKESMTTFGYLQPIVIDENNVIIIGHARTAAMREIYKDSPDKEITVLQIKYLNEEQKKMLRIVDNKVNESEYSERLLLQELEAVESMGMDLSAFGLSSFDLKPLDLPDAGKDKRDDMVKSFVFFYKNETYLKVINMLDDLIRDTEKSYTDIFLEVIEQA